MKVNNKIAALREERGFSVSAMAQAVGVTRQAIHAIETGTYIPNTAVALRLARILQTTVERLFELEDEPGSGFRIVPVELLNGAMRDDGRKEFPNGAHAGQTIQIARVGKRLVAATPSPVAWYIPAADGVLTGNASEAQIFDAGQSFDKRILIAGCDPGISVLARHLVPAGVELVMVHSNSVASLRLLGQDKIHIAGTHIRDNSTGEANLPAVRKIFHANNAAVISYAVWEQGICTAAGNPKGIRSVEDFARPDVTIVNREAGAGTRMFLVEELARLGIPVDAVAGFDRIAEGHLPAAWHVYAGLADACIATEAAARAFGLRFLHLTEERYDLALMASMLGNPLVQIVFDTLNRASFRRELETLGGYNTSVSGNRIL